MSSADDDGREFAGGNVYNTFNAETHIGSAQMGVGRAPPVARRRTGPLLDTECDEALRYYVPPAPFRDAAETLKRRGLVVLRGAHEIGKRAGSLALLDANGSRRPIYGLSPALTLSELQRTSYRAGHGYVVHGRLPDREPREAIEDGFDELARTLVRNDARLIVTTTAAAPGTPPELVADWQPPEPAVLLRRCLGDLGVPTSSRRLTARAAERFDGCRVPSEIVAYACRLAAAGGEEEAGLRLIDASETQTVRTWFEAEPTTGAVLLVAALCFVGEVTELEFERKLSLLEARLPAERYPLDDDETGAAPATTVRLRQRRRVRLEDVSLVTRSRDDSGFASDPRLVFAPGADRSAIVRELAERYGADLWDPLGEWLRAEARLADSDAALGIAHGLASLACAVPSEVRRSYLDAWAVGSASEREIACYTVWFAVLDDTLAAWALNLVLSWTSASDQRRRETALVCLAGEVGLRFPGEALRWMWHLARQAPATWPAPRRAFADLLCASLASKADDLSVLRFVAGRVDQARKARTERRARRSRNDGTYELSLRVVDELMLAQMPHGGLALAALVSGTSAPFAPAATVWAHGLRNRPHRALALRALLQTLRKLNKRDDGIERTRTLGTAIEAELGPREFQLLKRDLYPLLTAADRGDTSRAAAILAALTSEATANRDTTTKEGSDQ